MASGREHVVLRSVQTLFGVGAVGGLTDGQLLERFANRRGDEGQMAFAALVERHGPMVLGVCRGVLKDPDRTEDAFQATFLVLVRKCGSIRKQDSLGSWLYGVARRVAVRSKTGDARRRLREQDRAERRGEPSQGPAQSSSDDIEVLREEVARLPEATRAPVVLCHLEGMTYQDAARHLGLTEDAVRGRLARARELLRARLTRRGVTVPCALAGMAPWQEATAAMPAGLAESTARAALKLATGEAPGAGEVSASALALSRGVLRTMLLKKLISAGAAVAVLAVVAGTTLHAQQERRRDRANEPERSTSGPVDRDLARLIPGTIIHTAPVSKDCMVLLYLPDWSHGNVDNIAVANNDGGVRTLVNWRELDADLESSGKRIYLALYSRKTTQGGPVGPLQAYSVQAKWPEITSWKTLPEYATEPAASYKFVPGDGWKVFDITPVVRAQSGGPGHGVLLRFQSEDRSMEKKNWSGYEFVSREGTGEWASRRPRLLVVRPDGDFPGVRPRTEPPIDYDMDK